MTGVCYYCTKEEHHECTSVTCTCCGARNREHNRRATEMADQLRKLLAGPKIRIVQASEIEAHPTKSLLARDYVGKKKPPKGDR